MVFSLKFKLLIMGDNKWKKGPHAVRNKGNLSEFENVPAGDERKTVILDEDFEGLEFDDKVWLYWKRNKMSIILTVVAAFAVVFGVQSWKALKAQRASEMSRLYGAAETSEQLVEFADKYNGTPLAGAALLGAADDAYLKENISEAGKLYSKAALELKGNVLYGRALLGEAMCAKDKVSALKSVYENPSVQNSYRACAGYNLAFLYLDKNEKEAAKKLLQEISSNPENGMWDSVASKLLSENF